MDPFTWTSKGRTTSSNMHTAALCQYGKQWTIGRGDKRWSGISVLIVRHDDVKANIDDKQNKNKWRLSRDWDETVNHIMRCPWCNGYRRRKWTRRHEFKSRTRLIAFHIALILLEKVWIQLFSLQLWVNSRTDWVFQPWWGN